MKPQAPHSSEDRLLELAYGELPPAEARALEAHLEDCPRCTQALQQIRSVRTAMAPLRAEPVPDAGLDSLLAYAQQSARRNAEAPAPARRGWRRLLMPAAGLAAASLFGLVVLQVNDQVDLSQPEPEQVSAKAEPQAYDMAERAAPQLPAADPVAGAKAETFGDTAVEAEERAPVKRRKDAVATSKPVLRESKGARAAAPQELKKSARAEPPAEVMAAPEQERAEVFSQENAEGAVASTAADSAGASARAPAAASPSAGAPAPAPAAASPSRKTKAPRDAALLVREAEAARGAGDRAREALLLREALGAGAPERARLLRQLCEAELSLGRRVAAADACRAAVAQAPGSADARAAQRVLEQLGGSSVPAQ